MSAGKWFAIIFFVFILNVALVWKYVTSGKIPEVVRPYLVQPIETIDSSIPKRPDRTNPIVGYKYRVHYHCPVWKKTQWKSNRNDRAIKIKMDWLVRDLRMLGFDACVRKKEVGSMPINPISPFDPNGAKETWYWVEYILQKPSFRDFISLNRARKLEFELKTLRCDTKIEKIGIY